MIKAFKVIGLGILIGTGLCLLISIAIGYLLGVTWLFSFLPLPKQFGSLIGSLVAIFLPIGICLAGMFLDNKQSGEK